MEIIKQKQNNNYIISDKRLLRELDSARKTFSALKIFNAGLVGFNAFCLERVLSTGEGSIPAGVVTLILSATAFVATVVWEKEAKTNCERIATRIAVQEELSKSQNNEEAETMK